MAYVDFKGTNQVLGKNEKEKNAEERKESNRKKSLSSNQPGRTVVRSQFIVPIGTLSSAACIRTEGDKKEKDLCYAVSLVPHVFHQNLPKIPLVVAVSDVVSAD